MEAKEYTKKPVKIEAIQYTNLNREEIELFVGKKLKQELESETAYVAGKGPPKFSLIIPTLEGEHKAMPNDYIIKGVKGEFYPCKPDIFELTYSASNTHNPPRAIPSDADIEKKFPTKVMSIFNAYRKSNNFKQMGAKWACLHSRFLTDKGIEKKYPTTGTSPSKEHRRIINTAKQIGAKWVLSLLPKGEEEKRIEETFCEPCKSITLNPTLSSVHYCSCCGNPNPSTITKTT